MNNKELCIVITKTDLKRHNIANTDSNMVIDELAYASKQWTSNELWENNIEYEPYMPYEYDFETDLLNHTKTKKKFLEIIKYTGNESIIASTKVGKNNNLQIGAYYALNYPEAWCILLESYSERLKDERIDGISKEYNEQLQKELDNFADSQYKEWLYGDYRDYAGVIKEIAKYFTESRSGEYNKKKDEYIFTLDEQDLENCKDNGYTIKQAKNWLIDSIIASGNDRARKDKEESEKRKIERERVSQYKKERATQAEAERKAMLLSMKLK